MGRTWKEISRVEWSGNPGGDVSGVNAEMQVRVGCMQRIADATELMAKRYAELIGERDHYKKAYEMTVAGNLVWARRYYALKGVVTKLKRGRG